MRIAIPLLLLCVFLQLAPEHLVTQLEFDRQSILAGDIWRLWTGHLVHFSAEHAAVDLAVLFVVTWFAEHLLGIRRTVLTLLAGAFFISSGLLLLTPEMEIYRGSSALGAMMGFSVGMAIWHSDPKLNRILGTILVGFLSKTIIDAAGMLPAFTSLPPTVQVAWQAHALAVAFAILGRLRPSFEAAHQTPQADHPMGVTSKEVQS